MFKYDPLNIFLLNVEAVTYNESKRLTLFAFQQTLCGSRPPGPFSKYATG